MTTTPPSTSVQAQRRLVDERIAQLLAADAVQGLPDVPSARLLAGVAAQSLVSSRGGKRLRALLTLAAGAALDPDLHNADPGSDPALTAPTGPIAGPAGRMATAPSPGSPVRGAALLDIACAIEVFQTAALIHDDIIDDSDLRRGLPAAHKALAALFKAFTQARHSTASPTQATGTGLGIMLGDLLATQSLLIAAAAGQAVPGQATAITAAFLRMQQEVETGQIMDLADSAVNLDQPEAIIANCLTVFRWKTASYTTIAPLELGFLTAGLPPQQARLWAERIGSPLGVAFQLADDLIDIGQPAGPSGKPLGGDIKEGKHTVLLADSLLAAAPADRDRLSDLYARPAREGADIEQVITILFRSGAVERSQSRIADLWQCAQGQLAEWAQACQVPADRAQALSAYCRLFLPGLTD